MKAELFHCEIPFAPIPFRSGGQTHLAYEVMIHNRSRFTWALEQVEAASDHKPLLTWAGEEIEANSRIVHTAFRPLTIKKLKPKTIAFVFFWLSFKSGEPIPQTLHHQLHLVSKTGGQQVGRVSVQVQARSPILIDPPLRGKGWVAANTASNNTGHRRAPLPFDGIFYFPQRYAVDWVQFGADGLLYRGDPVKNENWYCYGADIHAVADGVVTEAKDGVIENTPLCEEMAVEITLQTAAGNYVMIDHGDEQYALYAHMLPGSLKVKPGDRVKSGDVIGRLGNSGNSDAPHLHFHIGHRNYPLAAHGLPYHFKSYERAGNAGDTERVEAMLANGECWKAEGEPQPRINEHMLDNDVVNFFVAGES